MQAIEDMRSKKNSEFKKIRRQERTGRAKN
jgi:hypothetical protein